MRRKIMLATLLSIMLSGCSATNNINDKAYEKAVSKKSRSAHDRIMATDNIRVPNNFFLLDTSWKLDFYNENKVDKDIYVTMNFTNSFNYEYKLMVSGKSACNSYSVDVDIDTNAHLFKASEKIMITNNNCHDPKIKLMDANFINTLIDNKKIEKFNNNRIILTDKHANTYEFIKK